MRYRFTLSNDILGDLILPVNPKGWEDIAILCKRSPKYHGIFFNELVSLEFLCGSGKEYLDSALALGIDTKVILLIESECFVGEGYEEEYTGRVQLKTWTTINGKSTADIIEDSIADTVLNRMDTSIDLTKLETLDGTALTPFTYGPYEMNLHSKAILLVSELSNPTDTSISDQVEGVGITPPATDRVTIGIALPINVSELDTISEYVDLLKIGESFNPAYPDTLFTADENGSYIIEYNIQGSITENFGIDREYSFLFSYRINSTETRLDDTGNVSYIGSSPAVHPLSYANTFTVNLNAGDTFSMFPWMDNYSFLGDGVGVFINVLEQLDSSSYIRIKKVTTTADTTANVHAVFEAGARIAQAITDQTDAFRSDYFGRKNAQPFAASDNGCGSFTAITNGALIRNFPLTDQMVNGNLQAGRPVRITMNEYFDSLNAIHNLGLGIERVSGVDYIRIEPKNYFYSNTLLFQLSNVPDIKISVAPEYYYNKINVGYDTWKIEQINGLDEVNSKRQYDLGLKTIDNTLEAMSSLIAGAYPLETARRKQFPNSFTEDFETDNNNFIICLNQSVDGSGNPNNLTTAEKDENFDSVSNVLDPASSYNLRISPARNALRWSPVLNVGLLAYPARSMKFTYGEGNFKMASEFTNDSCPGRWNNNSFSEGKDIQWDDANNTDNAPLWKPYAATFKFPLTRTQFNIIKSNPYGYLEISDRSTVYTKWYILEAKRLPVGGQTEFKLLQKYEA